MPVSVRAALPQRVGIVPHVFVAIIIRVTLAKLALELFVLRGNAVIQLGGLHP